MSDRICLAAFCRRRLEGKPPRHAATGRGSAFAKTRRAATNCGPCISDSKRLPYAFLARSTSALKPAGSLMAISESILRFSITPALMSPAMNFE